MRVTEDLFLIKMQSGNVDFKNKKVILGTNSGKKKICRNLYLRVVFAIAWSKAF